MPFFIIFGAPAPGPLLLGPLARSALVFHPLDELCLGDLLAPAGLARANKAAEERLVLSPVP